MTRGARKSKNLEVTKKGVLKKEKKIDVRGDKPYRKRKGKKFLSQDICVFRGVKRRVLIR